MTEKKSLIFFICENYTLFKVEKLVEITFPEQFLF